MIKFEDQFVTCSKDELIDCLKDRIKHIREINSFLKDKSNSKYEQIKFICKMKKLDIKTK